jgi:cytochrome c
VVENRRKEGSVSVVGALMTVGLAVGWAAGAVAVGPPARGPSPSPDGNQAPRVRIERPRRDELFPWDSLVRYVIAVSDAEDGESEFEEIPSNEVFLEVLYVSDPEAATGRRGRAKKDPPGLLLMKTTSCFNCHAVNTRVLGPPFSDVAARYGSDAATVRTLAERVSRGSEGVWGDVAMAPHPELSQGEVEQMVRWVLDHSDDPDRTCYAGTEGVFRTRPRPEGDRGGVYILTATYTDHGTGDPAVPRRRGEHTIVLRPAESPKPPPGERTVP